MKKKPLQGSLTRQLKEQALADSPQFSPLLHARIMQQIQPWAADVTQAQPATRNRIYWALPALATAALVIITATVWFHHPQTPRQTPQARVLPPNPSIPQFALQFPSSLNEVAGKPLTDANFGYLDRDAKTVLHYVITQFDVIPSTPVRHG